MSHKSIGNIDTGDVPEDEDRIIFCWNMTKNPLSLFVAKSQFCNEFGIMRHDRELGSYPSMGV